MMVIVLRVELRAIHEAHRALQPFVERARHLQLGRCRAERRHQRSPPRCQLTDRFRQRPMLMALRHRPESVRIGGCVLGPALAQIFETLLPRILDVGEMPRILCDRPASLGLSSSHILGESHHQKLDPRHDAAQTLHEVGQHPWWVNELEPALRPRRSLRLIHVLATLSNTYPPEAAVTTRSKDARSMLRQ